MLFLRDNITACKSCPQLTVLLSEADTLLTQCLVGFGKPLILCLHNDKLVLELNHALFLAIACGLSSDPILQFPKHEYNHHGYSRITSIMYALIKKAFIQVLLNVFNSMR